jgi:hypothetical protein
LTPKIAPLTPEKKILRSTFGARRPEHESFYFDNAGESFSVLGVIEND